MPDSVEITLEATNKEGRIPAFDMTMSKLMVDDTRIAEVTVNPGGVYFRFYDEDGEIVRLYHVGYADLGNAILDADGDLTIEKSIIVNAD